MARVVELTLGRPEDHVAVDRVVAAQHGRRGGVGLGHVAEPLDNGADARQVGVDDEVRDAVGGHHLGPAELQVGAVDVVAEQLVERHVPGEDDGRRAVLHDALAQAEHVGADADVAAGGERDGEHVAVGVGRLRRDHPRALQALDAEALLRADDAQQLVLHLVCVRVGGRAVVALEPAVADAELQCAPRLAHAHSHSLGDHGLAERLAVLGRKVEVLDAFVGIVPVVPLHAEALLDRLRQPKARAGVCANVKARDALRARQRRRLLEHIVLARAEGAVLDGQVVRDQDRLTPVGVFGGAQGEAPGDHPDAVLARLARRGQRDELAALGEREFDRGVEGCWHLLRSRRTHCNGCLPFRLGSRAEQSQQVVAVSGARLPAALPPLVDD
mmetsp:Transcript_33363/g.83168  ORF Transcript_33363/g.83168 Transcript_33363/m.83168 type:complete len:386 (-) Transcript_33363:4901-6058(-)